jgi:hypothetical protein
MPRIIEVLISPTGASVVQTKGYAGNDCLHASRFLEVALGAVLLEKPTAEFYQSQPVQQQAQQ